VPDPQPWRNPRPAPSLSEIRANTPTPRALLWLKAWWPAILWSGVIFTMSTDTFSADHTKWFFEPILRWLIPGLAQSQYDFMHHVIRKCAHFTEYFVFFVLLYRAARGRSAGWRWIWGITALFIAAGYSVLDEIHQAFVASRTASVYDSLLDSAGAFVALAVMWLWFRRRRFGAPPEASLDSTS
jgi:VanZ family protein